MNEFLKNANYVGNSPNKKDIKVTDSYEIDSPELLATAKGLYEIWQQVIAAKNSSDDSLDKIKKLFAFLQASGVDIGSLTPSFDGIVYEAPKDGNSYVRNNEAWLKLAEMVADVLDRNLYLRTKNAWSLYVPPTANSLNVYTKPEMDTHLQDIDASVLNAEKIAKEAAQQSLQIAQNVISIEQNVEKINHDLNEKIDSIPNIDEVIELTDNVSKIQTDVGKINTEINTLQSSKQNSTSINQAGKILIGGATPSTWGTSRNIDTILDINSNGFVENKTVTNEFNNIGLINESLYPGGDVREIALSDIIKSGKKYIIQNSLMTNIPTMDYSTGYNYITVDKRKVNGINVLVTIEIESIRGEEKWFAIWENNIWTNWKTIGPNSATINIASGRKITNPSQNNPYSMPFDGYVSAVLVANSQTTQSIAYCQHGTGYIGFGNVYNDGQNFTIYVNCWSPLLRKNSKIYIVGRCDDLYVFQANVNNQ